MSNTIGIFMIMAAILLGWNHGKYHLRSLKTEPDHAPIEREYDDYEIQKDGMTLKGRNGLVCHCRSARPDSLCLLFRDDDGDLDFRVKSVQSGEPLAVGKIEISCLYGGRE